MARSTLTPFPLPMLAVAERYVADQRLEPSGPPQQPAQVHTRPSAANMAAQRTRFMQGLSNAEMAEQEAHHRKLADDIARATTSDPEVQKECREKIAEGLKQLRAERLKCPWDASTRAQWGQEDADMAVAIADSISYSGDVKLAREMAADITESEALRKEYADTILKTLNDLEKEGVPRAHILESVKASLEADLESRPGVGARAERHRMDGTDAARLAARSATGGVQAKRAEGTLHDRMGDEIAARITHDRMLRTRYASAIAESLDVAAHFNLTSEEDHKALKKAMDSFTGRPGPRRLDQRCLSLALGFVDEVPASDVQKALFAADIGQVLRHLPENASPQLIDCIGNTMALSLWDSVQERGTDVKTDYECARESAERKKTSEVWKIQLTYMITKALKEIRSEAESEEVVLDRQDVEKFASELMDQIFSKMPWLHISIKMSKHRQASGKSAPSRLESQELSAPAVDIDKNRRAARAAAQQLTSSEEMQERYARAIAGTLDVAARFGEDRGVLEQAMISFLGKSVASDPTVEDVNLARQSVKMVMLEEEQDIDDDESNEAELPGLEHLVHTVAGILQHVPTGTTSELREELARSMTLFLWNEQQAERASQENGTSETARYELARTIAKDATTSEHWKTQLTFMLMQHLGALPHEEIDDAYEFAQQSLDEILRAPGLLVAMRVSERAEDLVSPRSVEPKFGDSKLAPAA